MAILHNRKDKAQLLKDLENESCSRKTVSFYRYVELDNLEDLRDELYREWRALGVLGRVYVAKEGINAQISLPEENWSSFVEQLFARPAFRDVPFKFAVEEGQSFLKLIIKVKHEIVAYRVPEDEYDMSVIGKHLTAQEYNEAIDSGAIVLDMRNQYEAEVGKFENAIVPDVDRSQELLAEAKRLLAGHEEDKILIYCTGGIRCEKASSYLMHHGFKDVNQLQGGIIQYAQDIKKAGLKSKFIGKNFVFDGRMGERITDDVIGHCHQCEEQADHHVNCANDVCHILFIQCDRCADAYQGCCSQRCADFINLPKSEQEALKQAGRAIFSSQLSDRARPRLSDVKDQL